MRSLAEPDSFVIIYQNFYKSNNNPIQTLCLVLNHTNSAQTYC